MDTLMKEVLLKTAEYLSELSEIIKKGAGEKEELKKGAGEKEELKKGADTEVKENREARAEAEKEYTIEDVRKILAAKSGAGFTAQVRELLARHGAGRLSELDKGEFASVIKEAEDIA